MTSLGRLKDVRVALMSGFFCILMVLNLEDVRKALGIF